MPALELALWPAAVRASLIEFNRINRFGPGWEVDLTSPFGQMLSRFAFDLWVAKVPTYPRSLVVTQRAKSPRHQPAIPRIQRPQEARHGGHAHATTPARCGCTCTVALLAIKSAFIQTNYACGYIGIQQCYVSCTLQPSGAPASLNNLDELRGDHMPW